MALYESIQSLPYREIWAVDFEFSAPPGERPDVRCLVAMELRSGRTLKLWRDQLGAHPPYSIDKNSLFIAYYASAELGCHRALGWPMPERILDLYPEFLEGTNGLRRPAGAGLLGALIAFGLEHIEAMEKGEMRDLAIRGGFYTDDEKRALLDYCETDVLALARLLPRMLYALDLPHALFRGRYMAAVSSMEYNGVPIDTATLDLLKASWTDIQDRLIAEIDKDYGVFDGRTFKADRFEDFIRKHGIPWGRTESGRLELNDDAFRQAAKAYPILSPLRELRASLSEMRLSDLAVGADGRNRCLLSPFGSRSGRNQPSNTRFIFGPSVWLRGLIKPPPGYGVAYIDWSQQEFGIAAGLSRDEAMIAAYNSGDPYLAFAKQAGAVPEDATKESHAAERELFKTCVLGVQYGMGEETLALQIDGMTPYPCATAKNLLRSHRETYKTFWRWSDNATDHAMLKGWIQTVFGWHIYTSQDPNPRSIRNFPMQANGAEMMRIAACLGNGGRYRDLRAGT